jgi:hypothetical protein
MVGFQNLVIIPRNQALEEQFKISLSSSEEVEIEKGKLLPL